METLKEQNRRKLTEALCKATCPEKTQQWSWDMMVWDEHLPILHLYGDHGTPDFTLTFCIRGAQDLVVVTPDSNPSWARSVITDYANLTKCAEDILVATLIINCVGTIQ